MIFAGSPDLMTRTIRILESGEPADVRGYDHCFFDVYNVSESDEMRSWCEVWIIQSLDTDL